MRGDGVKDGRAEGNMRGDGEKGGRAEGVGGEMERKAGGLRG